MKITSIPYNETLLSFFSTIQGIETGSWNLKETNLLFVEENEVEKIAADLFEEMRRRVLKRSSNFFWILLVRQEKNMSQFLRKKSSLGFWDAFHLPQNLQSEPRILKEIDCSIKNIQRLCKAI